MWCITVETRDRGLEARVFFCLVVSVLDDQCDSIQNLAKETTNQGMVKMDSNLNDYLNSTSELNQHHPTTINNINTSSLHLNQTQQNSLDHLTQELVNQDIRFSQLITQLSTYLTSQLIFTRIKTIHLIYQTIDRLLQLKPNYFKSSELNPIIDFLTDKLSDDPQILTEALQALQSLSQFTSFGLDQITRTCKASVNPSSSK